MKLCKHGTINQKLQLKVSRQINYYKLSNEKTFTVSPQTTENITVEGNLRSAVLLVVSKQLIEEIYSCQMLLYYPATEFLYAYLLSKKTFIFFGINFLSFANFFYFGRVK